MQLHIWHIDPLPDFLADHTLPGENESDRLREHSGRWNQFISSLWPWADRASFALRFIADAGEVRIFFIARLHPSVDPAEGASLRDELEVLLRTHRLLRRVEDGRAAPEQLAQAGALNNPVFTDLVQHTARGLWRPPLLNAAWRELLAAHPLLQSVDFQSPPVYYPLRGPGGPFLLPLESLISQPVRTALTVHLAPTRLLAHEWDWLAAMATGAQSTGDESLHALGRGAAARRVDPAAALAGKLYAASLRRLSAAPFMVLVQIAADAGRHDVARSVAGAVRAVLHEQPFQHDSPDAAELPTGADPYLAAHEGLEAYSAGLYESLDLSSTIMGDPLGRMPLLTDALGAGTLFRLPVSVRGGVPGVRVRQLPPDFRPGPRRAAPPEGEASIRLGLFEDGGCASIPLRDLTRHALITGFTGTGKTVTVLGILLQLWLDHRVPFLVIESAKREYRGMLGIPGMRSASEPRSALRIYTVGNESCVPMRLNPFEVLPGVRVEAHIARLRVCIEAAVPPLGPSSSIIAEALHKVYESHGWLLTDTEPVRGGSRRTFPRLREFVETVDAVIVARGYKSELLSNLRAALVGRFQPLLLGSIGAMFDAQRSSPPPAELFAMPTIIEMNDLSLDDKALASMFLLTLLREHRESSRIVPGALAHVTVVEEAHNVLEDVGSEGGGEGATRADTRFKAVQAFCAMLAEVRALGEGLIIADQSPEKLARDAVRNTNLQIAHQLRDSRDRAAVARAMIMDDEQEKYLGKLEPGHAALFRTGLEKATFVRVDPLSSRRGAGFNPVVTDSEVMNHMRAVTKLDRHIELPLAGCRLCSSPCKFRDAMFPVTRTTEARAAARGWWSRAGARKRKESGLSLAQVWDQAADRAVGAVADAELPWHEDAAWCHFIHEWGLLTETRPVSPATTLDEEHHALFLAALRRIMGAAAPSPAVSAPERAL